MVLNHEAIVEKLRVVIAEHQKMSLDEVKPDSDLSLDLGMDSLDFTGLILRIEEEFDVELELPDSWDWYSEPKKGNTIFGLADLICKEEITA